MMGYMHAQDRRGQRQSGSSGSKLCCSHLGHSHLAEVAAPSLAGADVAVKRSKAQSWRRRGGGARSPGADVAGVSPISGEAVRAVPPDGAGVRQTGAWPVPVQMWRRGEPNVGAGAAAASPVGPGAAVAAG